MQATAEKDNVLTGFHEQVNCIFWSGCKRRIVTDMILVETFLLSDLFFVSYVPNRKGKQE